MWVLLIPVIIAVLFLGLGVILFIALPIKWAIVAVVVCVFLAGGLLSLMPDSFH